MASHAGSLFLALRTNLDLDKTFFGSNLGCSLTCWKYAAIVTYAVSANTRLLMSALFMRSPQFSLQSDSTNHSIYIYNHVSHRQVTGIPEACTRELHSWATWAWCYQMPGLSTMEPRNNRICNKINRSLSLFETCNFTGLFAAGAHTHEAEAYAPGGPSINLKILIKEAMTPGTLRDSPGPAHLKPAAPGYQASWTIFLTIIEQRQWQIKSELQGFFTFFRTNCSEAQRKQEWHAPCMHPSFFFHTAFRLPAKKTATIHNLHPSLNETFGSNHKQLWPREQKQNAESGKDSSNAFVSRLVVYIYLYI